jgi:hypothetical protein
MRTRELPDEDEGRNIRVRENGSEVKKRKGRTEELGGMDAALAVVASARAKGGLKGGRASRAGLCVSKPTTCSRQGCKRR